MSNIPGAILGLSLPTLILFFSSPEHNSLVPTQEDFNCARLRTLERVRNFTDFLPLSDNIMESSFCQFVDNVIENVQELKKNIPQIIKGE